MLAALLSLVSAGTAAPGTAGENPAVTSGQWSQTSTSVRGITNEEIRFGISAPLSGPSKDLGQQMRLGIETAFQAENDDGGVKGAGKNSSNSPSGPTTE